MNKEKSDGGATVSCISLLADATDALRAVVAELENYTFVHGADEDDEHALALARAVLARANAKHDAERRSKANDD